jgi:Na+-driven multidrug efflux pump
MGKPLPGVVISALRVIVVFLPLAFFGRWMFDLPGLFGASLVANLVMGLAAFTWLGHQIRASRTNKSKQR